MNLGAQGKSPLEFWYSRILFVVYGGIGLPLVIGLAYLLWPQTQAHPTSVVRIQKAEMWLEPLPASATFSQAYFAKLGKQLSNFEQADWKVVSFPSVAELGTSEVLGENPSMARAWFKFSVPAPQGADPSNPWMLYGTRAMGGPYSVWVNGQLVFANLDNWRMLWNKPIFIVVPEGARNSDKPVEILFALPHRVNLGYALGSLYVGNQSDLNSSNAVRSLLQVWLPLVSMLMIGVTGLFALGLWARRRQDSANLWLFLMAVSLIACNLQFTHDVAYSEVRSQWFGSLVDSATSWVFMSFFIFVQRYSGITFPKMTVALAIFTSASTVLTLPLWDWQVYALRLQHYILLFIYSSVLFILTWVAVRYRRRENLLFCLAIWILFLTGMHDLSFMTAQLLPDQIFLFPFGALVLFFVAEYLLRYRYQVALSQVEHNNEVLQTTLQDREKEILAQQQLLHEAREQVVLATERARLSRDIHDGIGSALTGTLIRLRGNATSTHQAAEQVQRCLEDIRLVLDSMEPTQNDLPLVFANLRRSFSDAFAAAGVQADWQIGDLESLQLQSANASLNLTRVIQEILTNALKHAHANKVSIQASIEGHAQDQAKLIIEIVDDGQGFDPRQAPSGRGLGNVRQRIAQLNGELQIESRKKNGTRIGIVLPANFLAEPIGSPQ